MDPYVLYNLKVGVCLVVFYLFYKLLLSRETFHRLNRFLLLGGIAAAFLLPVWTLTFVHEMPAPVLRSPLAPMPVPASESSPMYTVVAAEGTVPAFFPWERLLCILFAAGTAVSLGRTLWSLSATLRIIRRGRLEPLDGGIVLSRHDGPQHPFSWGRWIVISETDFAENGCEIVGHEQAHIRRRHSADLLATDLLGALQWFNPAMWLLRGELRTLHEYEADAAVLASGTDRRLYQLLLVKKAVGGRWYSVANSLDHSNLKNRITMMLRKKSSGWARAKTLCVLPLVCVALGAFAQTEYVVTDGKDMQNTRTAKGFSGSMTVKSDGAGRMRVIVNGTGDAFGGVAALISANDEQQKKKSEEGGEKLFLQILSGVGAKDSAGRIARPLCVLDGRKLTSDDELPDADRIAEFYVMDKVQGVSAYGRVGRNGVIEITSKRPAETEGKTRREHLRSGAVGISMTGSNPDEPIREAIAEISADRPDVPVERQFSGIAAFRMQGTDRAEAMVYGSGDAMMAVASLLGNTEQFELNRIVYRLSRTAPLLEWLMAYPMPLTMVDGIPIASAAEVPDADRIFRFEVLSTGEALARYGEPGAGGAVLIVTKPAGRSDRAEIDAFIARGVDSWLSALDADEKPSRGNGYYSERSQDWNTLVIGVPPSTEPLSVGKRALSDFEALTARVQIEAKRRNLEPAALTAVLIVDNETGMGRLNDVCAALREIGVHKSELFNGSSNTYPVVPATMQGRADLVSSLGRGEAELTEVDEADLIVVLINGKGEFSAGKMGAQDLCPDLEALRNKLRSVCETDGRTAHDYFVSVLTLRDTPFGAWDSAVTLMLAEGFSNILQAEPRSVGKQ